MIKKARNLFHGLGAVSKKTNVGDIPAPQDFVLAISTTSWRSVRWICLVRTAGKLLQAFERTQKLQGGTGRGFSVSKKGTIFTELLFGDGRKLVLNHGTVVIVVVVKGPGTIELESSYLACCYSEVWVFPDNRLYLIESFVNIVSTHVWAKPSMLLEFVFRDGHKAVFTVCVVRRLLGRHAFVAFAKARVRTGLVIIVRNGSTSRRGVTNLVLVSKANKMTFLFRLKTRRSMLQGSFGGLGKNPVGRSWSQDEATSSAADAASSSSDAGAFAQGTHRRLAATMTTRKGGCSGAARIGNNGGSFFVIVVILLLSELLHELVQCLNKLLLVVGFLFQIGFEFCQGRFFLGQDLSQDYYLVFRGGYQFIELYQLGWNTHRVVVGTIVRVF